MQINAVCKTNKSFTHVSSYIEPMGFRCNVVTEEPTNHTNMKSLNNNTLAAGTAATQKKTQPPVSVIFRENAGNSALPECSEAHILSLIYGCLS